MIYKYMLTKDIYPQLQKLLNLPDLHISDEIVVRLKINDVVRVDINGIIPEREKHSDQPAK